MSVFQFDHLVGTRGGRVRREKKSFFSPFPSREIRQENSLYNFIQVPFSKLFFHPCYYNNNNNTCVVYFYLPLPDCKVLKIFLPVKFGHAERENWNLNLLAKL